MKRERERELERERERELKRERKPELRHRSPLIPQDHVPLSVRMFLVLTVFVVSDTAGNCDPRMNADGLRSGQGAGSSASIRGLSLRPTFRIATV